MRAMGNKFKMVNCNSNNVTNVTNSIRKRGLTPEETRRDSTGFDKKDVRKTTET